MNTEPMDSVAAMMHMHQLGGPAVMMRERRSMEEQLRYYSDQYYKAYHKNNDLNNQVTKLKRKLNAVNRKQRAVSSKKYLRRHTL